MRGDRFGHHELVAFVVPEDHPVMLVGRLIGAAAHELQGQRLSAHNRSEGRALDNHAFDIQQALGRRGGKRAIQHADLFVPALTGLDHAERAELYQDQRSLAQGVDRLHRQLPGFAQQLGDAFFLSRATALVFNQRTIEPRQIADRHKWLHTQHGVDIDR